MNMFLSVFYTSKTHWSAAQMFICGSFCKDLTFFTIRTLNIGMIQVYWKPFTISYVHIRVIKSTSTWRKQWYITTFNKLKKKHCVFEKSNCYYSYNAIVKCELFNVYMQHNFLTYKQLCFAKLSFVFL